MRTYIETKTFDVSVGGYALLLGRRLYFFNLHLFHQSLTPKASLANLSSLGRLVRVAGELNRSRLTGQNREKLRESSDTIPPSLEGPKRSNPLLLGLLRLMCTSDIFSHVCQLCRVRPGLGRNNKQATRHQLTTALSVTPPQALDRPYLSDMDE